MANARHKVDLAHYTVAVIAGRLPGGTDNEQPDKHRRPKSSGPRSSDLAVHVPDVVAGDFDPFVHNDARVIGAQTVRQALGEPTPSRASAASRRCSSLCGKTIGRTGIPDSLRVMGMGRATLDPQPACRGVASAAADTSVAAGW